VAISWEFLRNKFGKFQRKNLTPKGTSLELQPLKRINLDDTVDGSKIRLTG